LKMRKEVVALALAAMIFLSMQFSSLPLVFADNTVPWASFPPDLPGDVNADTKVDILDLSIVSKAYGSTFGGPKWNPCADVNDDGKVDILDTSMVSKNFGKTYSTSATPISYSASFEFNVPNDGNAYVWYYILLRFHVPRTLSNKTFNLVAGKSVDDAIRNVKVDNKLIDSSVRSGLFNIMLGQLLEGYHLLELEYLESMGAGLINFAVKTANNEYAWLDRFRMCVPNYSDNEYRYTVKTRTYFPIDYFFLGGLADDFIDDVYLDNTFLMWRDWEWDSKPGAEGDIFNWDFMYPLGQLSGWHDINFTFGEIWRGGLLDFQYLSRTQQQDRIGNPKFWTKIYPPSSSSLTIYNGIAFAGSKWDSIPGSRQRFTAGIRVLANTTDTSTFYPAPQEAEVSLFLDVPGPP